MSSNVLGIIELTLVFGSVLGIAGYELWSLRQEKARSEKKKADSPNK